MNNSIHNYLTQLIETPTIGNAPARFSYHEQGGNVGLLDEGLYSFLFVLQGGIKVITAFRTEVLADRSLMVIDKRKMEQCICLAHTVLLEFLPPKRIEYFFNSASRAFGTACSEHVAFIADIDQWIEQLYNDCRQGNGLDEYSYCCQLRRLLRNYPDIVLGTLVIPLHACAMTSGKCAQCKKQSTEIQALLERLAEAKV